MLNPWGFGSALQKKKKEAPMHFRIRRFGVAATMAAVCSLLLWTPVVHAQAQGPGNLIGEDMIATSFVASSDYPACTAAVNYSVSGPAAGPYPGSFNQSV